MDCPNIVSPKKQIDLNISGKIKLSALLVTQYTFLIFSHELVIKPVCANRHTTICLKVYGLLTITFICVLEHHIPDVVILFSYNKHHSFGKAFVWSLAVGICSFSHMSIIKVRH